MMKSSRLMISKIDIGKPVIVLGMGGHAKVVIDSLQLCGRTIIGLTDTSGDQEPDFMGINVIGNDDSILEYAPAEVDLVNGLGAIPGSFARRKLHMSMIEKGYRFGRVIHPSAIIASAVELGEGVQVMAGAVIQPGSKIGDSCIINTRATVDHDCEIEAHCHLAPGVTLSGGVTVGGNSHIGTGASVIQGISIGRNCIVAAGATVYRNLEDGTRYIPRFETEGSKRPG